MKSSSLLPNDTRFVYENSIPKIMESQPHQQGAEQATLNPLGLVVSKLAQYGENASRNIQSGFNNMSLQSWIRLTVFVGGYMLLRPYIMKLSTKVAVRKMEQQEEQERKAKEEAAKLSPNDIRGLKSVAEEDEDVDERADGSGADWGSRARVRQRKVLRQMLEAEEKRREEEAEEKRREEEAEDADIQEYLVD